MIQPGYGSSIIGDEDLAAYRTASITEFVLDLTQGHEALLAAIPGVTLSQLWQLLGVAEAALFGISACVVLAGLIGLLTTLLTSLNIVRQLWQFEDRNKHTAELASRAEKRDDAQQRT